MTTNNLPQEDASCPAEGILKQLSGKWKPQIFRLALEGPVRFNSLLRQLPGSNKQSVSTALKEMEEAEILVKTVVQEKPLHIEYTLSEKGMAMISIFRSMEGFLR
ncbi:helix-turn-helix transcriptional regulator [Pontibacter sp. HSC-14F20]|uniref:winged helix-turn-helix transcriptional regulator n=1 Tax=Pontibacter sp. HSC-14F20 TaxID=2864136 RepID=UPI001C72CB14|nr:helix-turn-helix domain-containing protein [Pontibacter sp. HSC-14F20]MBX0333055.1 helix-turn-helix transcriptional regulator [Pontibacter sp. HSC-14F20]